MNSIAMNLVANLMNTTFKDVNYVNRSGQDADSSSFKDVIQKTRDVSNHSEEGVNRNVESKSQPQRFERPNKRVEQSAEKNDIKSQDKMSKEEVPVEVETGKKNAVTKDENISLEASQHMETFSLENIQAIADLMNVSMDEVQATLQELEMDIEDLFDVEKLMEFVTVQMGLESSTELLMTEGAVEQYKQVAALLEEFSTAFNERKQWVTEQSATTQGKADEQVTLSTEIIGTTNQSQEQAEMNFSKQESSEASESADLGKSLLTTNSEEKNQIPTGFESTLNQVVTEKVETIVMNGEIRTVHTEITAKNVFDQIVTGLKVEVTQGKQDIMLQLQPEHLGKIAVNISRENGIMTGQFVAESEAVKSLIEKNIPALKQQLEAQGIDLRDIKITVGDSKAFFAGKDSERESEKYQQTMGQNKKRHLGIDRVQQMINEQLEDETHVERANHMDSEMSSIEFQA
jgi:flagellar hook-length control protein FliK